MIILILQIASDRNGYGTVFADPGAHPPANGDSLARQAEEFILNIISLKKEPMGIIKSGSNIIRTVYLKILFEDDMQLGLKKRKSKVRQII